MKDWPSPLPGALATVCARDPLVIVDAGGRGGPEPRWRALEHFIVWIGFEPDRRSADLLTDLPADWQVLPIALSDRQGCVTLYRTRDEGDSSLLQPNQAFLSQFERPERFDVVDTIQLEADTLDHQLQLAGVSTVDVLKLDTQGTELAILQGASSTLAGSVFAVDIEVEFNPLYRGQPLIGDVDRHLRPLGFQLMDLAPRRAVYAAGRHLQLTKGQLVWAEGLYLRTVEAFIADFRQASPSDSAARLARALTVCLAYGFPDYALALLEAATSRLGGDDAERLREAVTEWDRTAVAPVYPLAVDVTPDQLRAMKGDATRPGAKPTRVVRELIRTWMKSEKAPS